MILKGIESQVKGTAAATADASVQMGLAFGEISESVGAGLLPAFQGFAGAVLPLVQSVLPQIESVMNEQVGPALENATEKFAEFITLGMDEGFGTAISGQFSEIGESIAAFFGEGGLEAAFETLSELRMTLFDSIMKALPGILEAIIAFIPGLVEFITGTMLPTLLDNFTEMMTQVLELFAVLFPEIVQALADIIPSLVEGVSDLLPAIVGTLSAMIPQLLQTGIEVFMSLVNAVVDILPGLLDTIIGMLPEIVKSIVEMLPGIIEAGVELFNGLVTAVVDILPDLLVTILGLLPEILDSIIAMLPELIDAGFDLFFGLVTGLLEALPQIIDAVIGMIPEITGALLENIPKLVIAGIEIVKGLAKGIVDNAPKLLAAAVGALGETLVNGVKGFLGIRSPSKVFMEIGQNVGVGMADGISGEEGNVKAAALKLGLAASEAADKVVNGIKEKFKVITNIPGMMQAEVEQTTKITAAMMEQMSKEVDGIYAKFNEAGDLVRSYTGYGKETMVNMAGGGQFDVGKITDSLNSLSNNGYQNVPDAAFGGSFQQALDKLMGQQTFVNKKTGMSTTVGGDLTPEALARIIGPGFVAVPKLDKSVEDLTDAINSINTQVAAKGLTPFANGGFVTGPVPALLGEAGPEVVMPLDRFESMFGMTNRNTSKGSSGSTINITVNAGMGSDGGRIGAVIVDEIKKFERSNGPVFAGA